MDVLLQNKAIKLNRDAKSGKSFIPIRPIVLSGDNCTFVCDARLSFFLAEEYVKAFENSEHDAYGTMGC